MKSLLLIPALALLLVACEGPSTYYARSASGNVVCEKRWGQIGGTRSGHRSDGSSETNQYGPSLRDFVTAAAGAVGKVSTNIKDSNINEQNTGVLKAANGRKPTVVDPIITPTGEVVYPQVIQPPPAAIPKQ